jgi:cell fate regulator YaaT (PSP1 superfamily)
MPLVCAVTFQPRGRLYYADPGALGDLEVGDHVLYPTTEGPEVAQVVWAPTWSADDVGSSAWPVLVGRAATDAISRAERSRRRRADVRVAAKKLIREHGLPMKVAGVDHVVETNHSTVYFTAPHRVDFRSLVRDLAATMNGKVELRQLSARDEAKLTGGIGSCGRELCCATFLVEYEPVSVRMAKDQDLPTNPVRIAGACGKLMCCLKYEHPLYQDFVQRAPKKGEKVSTPDGSGTVVGSNVPSESVVVRLDDSGRRTTCGLADVCGSRQAFEQRESAADAG